MSRRHNCFRYVHAYPDRWLFEPQFHPRYPGLWCYRWSSTYFGGMALLFHNSFRCLMLLFFGDDSALLATPQWAFSLFKNINKHSPRSCREAIATLWFLWAWGLGYGSVLILIFYSPTATFLVQIWFASRIWMISMRKNVLLPALIALLASASWGKIRTIIYVRVCLPAHI